MIITSTETVGLLGTESRQARTATSTFTQLLSSEGSRSNCACRYTLKCCQGNHGYSYSRHLPLMWTLGVILQKQSSAAKAVAITAGRFGWSASVFLSLQNMWFMNTVLSVWFSHAPHKSIKEFDKPICDTEAAIFVTCVKTFILYSLCVLCWDGNSSGNVIVYSVFIIFSVLSKTCFFFFSWS